MCLIALAWRAVPGVRLIVAANRDEFHERPTAQAGFWPDAPEILAGRDLKDGGTWMGLTRGGRFAALTNHRSPVPGGPAERSRGHLVADFLRDAAPADGYCDRVRESAHRFNGFNLLAADTESLWYVANHGAPAQPVQPGVHTLSNARLNTPWPKARGLAAALAAACARGDAGPRMIADLFDALGDTGVPADADLPDTGVGLERERMLSPRKIVAPVYGTRSSCVLILREDGAARLDERSFDSAGRLTGEISKTIPASASARG